MPWSRSHDRSSRAATYCAKANALSCRMACALHRGAVIAADLASWALMSISQSRRFPVTVTHLPVTRCRICHGTVASVPSARS